MDLRAYIEERSIPEPNTGCWIWLRYIGSHGYGTASAGDNRVTCAHRISYRAFKGPIPDRMLIQHSCDNRWCVAPHHLSVGTEATNNLDMRRKGRAARKLNASDVRAIRSAAKASTKIFTDASMARVFGVDKAMIRRVRLRRAWSHVL